MGKSHICELTDKGRIIEYEICPEQFGIKRAGASDICRSGDKTSEADRMKRLLSGNETNDRTEIVCLNTALIFYISGRAAGIFEGFKRAKDLVSRGVPIKKLNEWVRVQQ